MADATVYAIKVALCPACGAERLFYEIGTPAKPVAFGGAALLEAKDVRDDATAFAQITGYTNKTLTDDLAVWSTDEHKGKVVDVAFSDATGVTETHVIESNTDTVLTLKTRLRGKHRLPSGSARPSGLFDDENLPKYRIREDDFKHPDFKSKVKTKLWDNNTMICDKCGETYTV
jgi:hypothetical protein